MTTNGSIVVIRRTRPALCTDGEESNNERADTILRNLYAIPMRSVNGETVATRSLPSELVYDQTGLQLFDIHSQRPIYYLFHSELSILRKYGSEIAKEMFCGKHTPKGAKDACLIDMGSGSLKKITALLAGVHSLIPTSLKSATYYALDLDEAELNRTLGEIHREHNDIIGSPHEGKIAAKGVCADYNEDLGWIRAGEFEDTDAPGGSHHVLLYMGSTLSNDTAEKSTAFLRRIRDTGMRPGDMILIAMDQCQDADRVMASYSDAEDRLPSGIHSNALKTAAKLAGFGEALDPEDFEYYPFYNKQTNCHERYMRALRDVVITTAPVGSSGQQWRIAFAKGDLILLGVSYKWSSEQVQAIFAAAGLETVRVWMDEEKIYSVTLLRRAE